MADDAPPLRLRDPVHVDPPGGGDPLEGIVSHLGPVQFAPGSDWVGIRLTGPSAGKGKNDGSVKGVRYFDAGGGEGGGTFVKRAALTKRQMTKLDELRLRRELGEKPGAGGAGGGGGGGSISSNRRSSAASSTASSTAGASGRRTSGIRSPPKSAPSSTSPARTPAKPTASGGGGGGGGGSKLEEIRARREALMRERGVRGGGGAGGSSGGGSAPSEEKAESKEDESKEDDDDDDDGNGNDDDNNNNDDTNDAITAEDETDDSPKPPLDLSGATSTYRAELRRLQGRVSSLEASLKRKEAERASLQSSLDFMSRGAEQSTHDAVRMYAMGALALTEARSPKRAEGKGSGGAGGAGGGGGAGGEEKGGSDSDDESGSEEEEGDESEDEDEGVVHQAAAAVSAALVRRNDELTEQLAEATKEHAALRHRLDESEEKSSNVRARYEEVRGRREEEAEARNEERRAFAADKAVLTSQVGAVRRVRGARQSRAGPRLRVTFDCHAGGLLHPDLPLGSSPHFLRRAPAGKQPWRNASSHRSSVPRSDDPDPHSALFALPCSLPSQVASLERELGVLQERASARSSTEGHSHATLAKLRAELTSLQRRNEEMENDKMELEVTLEELVLDKEGLGQEKELLEDQLEECKIDLESAQLELEDARAQLEEQRGAERAAEEEGAGGGADAAGADSQDVARSLSVQNARLRTALIRLREQSEAERSELQRRVRAYESDAASRGDVEAELAELKDAHATALRESRELKDLVDQTSSLEETIEALGDKVFVLEERNADLERTVREMEESAEVAAEMEEVQADELKMVMRDLEGRDALVRNLEEAIRMQRRREEDFQRYVSEFRSSIATLKQEKVALLTLTENSSGERSQLLATSKKALAQAAQLAEDAAEARKRSSEAAFQTIAARSAAYLNQRLESLLPSGVVSAELAAVKGEMSLARVADKAAVSLVAVEEVFGAAINRGSSAISEFDTLDEGAKMILSDAAAQQAAVMAHQAEFSRMAIEAGTDALRLMAAGNWPELLSQEMSADLGSVVVHSVTDLDFALSEQLRLLKSEGVLSPLRSSLADLDQSVRNTRLALFSATDESGKAVIPNDWKPPVWEALRSLSLGRFACLGATAVLSSAVSPMEGAEDEPPPATPRGFGEVITKAKQSCSSMLDVCKKLSGLRLNDVDTLVSLNDLSSQYQASSCALFECVKTIAEEKSMTLEDLNKCALLLEKVLAAARQLAALLRKADLGDHDTTNHHYLSAEFGDSWGGVTEIVSQVRGVDGDSEDVNYLMRARAIESQLADAVENEPKLVIANAKIASLEKSLSSRSKEIQMQNARISELERLIQASSPANPMSPLKGSMASPGTPVPSVDTEKLKEEVRVLQEAVDVMQKQAEEYEKEIRSLKDKSRTSRGGVRTAGGRSTPRKSSSMDLEATLNQLGQGSKSSGASSSRDVLLESISLETALFRPALSSAVHSASYWKSQAMGSALSKLAPLNVPVPRQSMPSSTGSDVMVALNNLLSKGDGSARNRSHYLDELALAKNESRLAKASFSVADLSKGNIPSRIQLSEARQKEQMAETRLRNAASMLLKSTETEPFASFVPSSSGRTQDPLGRISLPCRDGVSAVASLVVNDAELRNMHSLLLQ
ncbi:hypothetical protein ACHAWF_015767 [Thalassiosira exigua]